MRIFVLGGVRFPGEFGGLVPHCFWLLSLAGIALTPLGARHNHLKHKKLSDVYTDYNMNLIIPVLASSHRLICRNNHNNYY